MYDLLYYISLPLILASVSLASCYIIYPKETNKYIVNLTWKASTVAIECSELKEKINEQVKEITDKYFKSKNKDEDKNEDDDEEDSLVFYNSETNNTYLTSGINLNKINEEMVSNKAINVVFVKKSSNDDLYYRVRKFNEIENILDNDLEVVEKKFIQVEYITQENGNEKIIDIHNNLGKFYVKGNIILDKHFLKWYLDTFYNIKLNKDYSLRLFDKDVNMFTLNKESGIFLTKDTYSILDVTNEVFYITDSTYEGAEKDTESESESGSESGSGSESKESGSDSDTDTDTEE